MYTAATTPAAATTTVVSPPTTTPGVTYSVGGGCPVPQGGFGICPSNCGPGRNCTLPKLCCAQACGGQDCVNPCAVLQCPKSCSSFASDGAGCPTCTCARKYWLQNISFDRVSSILWRNFSYLLAFVLIERFRTQGGKGGGEGVLESCVKFCSQTCMPVYSSSFAIFCHCYSVLHLISV